MAPFPQRTTLGRTGISVSKLGLASGYNIDARSVERCHDEYGINYFFWSTLRSAAMGTGLRNLVARGRDDLVIGVHSYDHAGFLTGRAVDTACKALGTDHIDVLILGWCNSMPFRRVMDHALKLKEQGRIQAIGISGHNRSFFGQLLKDGSPEIDVMMLRYNAAHPGAERDIFPHAGPNRPGTVCFTATSWGKLLSSKKLPPHETPLSAADCYRFVLSNPNIDLSLMGPRTEEEMLADLGALDLGPLTDEEMARVRRIGKFVG